jgi:hypothetical protein
MGERNTAVLLQEWGVWLKQDSGFNLRARSAMLMVYQPPRDPGDGYANAQITNEDAEEVDRIMAKLKYHFPREFRVVWLAVVEGYSNRAVADSMGLPKDGKRAASMYEDGFRFVDTLLNRDFYLADTFDHENILQAA